MEDKKAQVLIVDDEVINLHILIDLLKDSYCVRVARNSAQALKVLEKDASSIDLILLDVVMPGMDGYELCKILKKREDTAEIPLLFVTSNQSVEDEEYGLSLGAVDYILKPYRPNSVKLKVDNHIRIKKSKEKLLSLNENLQEQVKSARANLPAQDVFFLSSGVKLDLDNAQVHKEDEVILLSKKERELLHLFLRYPNRILTKEEIEYALWNGEHRADSSVKTLIRKVRLKIGEECIETVKNIGYRFLK